MRRSVPAVVLALGLLATALPVSAAAAAEAIHSPNLVPVANLPYAAHHQSGVNRGTDIEFARLLVDGSWRDVAVAGSYDNGLQLIDITDPTAPVQIGRYDCGVSQGDVQVFSRGDRTYATYTMDAGYTLRQQSRCVIEARDLGLLSPSTPGALDLLGDFGRPGIGTYIVDITDPTAPVTVSHVAIAKGSHNMTVHPSGDYLYNSNSQLYTTAADAGIEVYDIRDFARPRMVAELVLPPTPGLGAESHDVSFNPLGTRAYSAAISQTVVIDTTVVDRPAIVSLIVDPAINVHHQSSELTLSDPLLGTRQYLLIEDEFAGASGGDPCPSGGVHVYDITGPLERAPVKVGYWNLDEVRKPGVGSEGSRLDRCTMHVFQLHPEAGLMTIAAYNGGVRVVDLGGLLGVSLGDTTAVGMREVGFARFPNSDTWAAKTPRIAEDGSFYLYGNDQRRGLDVYRFDPAAPASTSPGVWLDAASAAALPRYDAEAIRSAPRPFCLLRGGAG